jgi:hypothetical protein
MFEHVSLAYVLFPVVVSWVVVVGIVRFRSRNEDPLKRAFQRFKFLTIATGTTLIMLWFCLPHTPGLATFGYPKSIEDVKTPELVLRYLQDYNKALVRTTEVVYWVIFLFVGWFLTSLFDFTKAVAHSAGGQARRKEPRAVPEVETA